MAHEPFLNHPSLLVWLSHLLLPPQTSLPPFISILVSTFRAHRYNPGYSPHLKIFSLILSASPLCCKEKICRFWGLRCGYFLEGTLFNIPQATSKQVVDCTKGTRNTACGLFAKSHDFSFAKRPCLMPGMCPKGAAFNNSHKSSAPHRLAGGQPHYPLFPCRSPGTPFE